MPLRAADQFVKVNHPGWTNTSQYSVTGAWGDYDKDGFIDLFVANSTEGWGPRANFLYRNNGDGTFTPTTAAQVGGAVTDLDPSVGGYWGDFNNDGRLDVFALSTLATVSSPPVINRLYLNLGDGAFTSADGGDLTKPCYAGGWAAVADYDNDGWLDVYVPTAWAEAGRRTNLLYHARGDGQFALVTDSPVVTDRVSMTLSALWGDYDNDGDVDLVVANNQDHDFFYRNDGGSRFTRLTNSLLERPGYLTRHQAWGDYDNDGFLDLASGCRESLRLFRNDGGSDFLVATNWTAEVDRATPVWADYDNDGHLDLLAIRGQSVARQLRLLHNNGDGTFDRVEEAFTRPAGYWLGGGWGDYDNDGFLDLFVANDTGQNALYHNEGNGNHWLKFQLESRVSNGAAIGAKVRVRATISGKTVWQMREVSGGNFCQNDLRPNFGLGDATVAEVIRIEWPSGNVQEYLDQPADQIMYVTEVARIQPARPSASLGGSVTLRSVSGSGTYQWRFEGVDLAGETKPTLALTNLQASQQGRYSVVVTAIDGTVRTNFAYLIVDPTFTKITEGPVVTDTGSNRPGSWGDYDNDGNIDLLVARTVVLGTNSLYRGHGDGTFTLVPNMPFARAAFDWSTFAWGDYDNDGLLDLAAATLGNVAGPMEFFHNQGNGAFTGTSSGVAEYPLHLAWADYDRDGFLDLLVPNFDAKAADALYHNNGDGTFRSMTENEVGSIVAHGTTDAVFCGWGDYDDDGWPDLVAVAAPTRLHHNLEGRFELVTTNAVARGSGLVGAWGDYDNDGRLDLFVAVCGAQSRLYRNVGSGAFVSVTRDPVVADAGNGCFNGASWADYDNDGFLDLFVTDYSGMNCLYHNNGNGTFARVTMGSPVNERASPAACGSGLGVWLDFDNNGFLDLYVPNFHNLGTLPTTSFLYRNNGNSNGWLTIKPVGTASNRSGVGAKVRVKATYRGQTRWQRRDISGGGEFNGNQLYAHFGLGEATRADLVRIEWPSGIVQELTNIPANQILTVTEPPTLEALGEGRLRILCWARQTYEVEVSDDLARWTSLGVLTTDQHRPVILDLGAADHPYRFYRAKGW